MNQIGITEWTQPYPLAELAPILKRNGLNGIALCFASDYKENSVFEPTRRAEALRVKEEFGVEYPSIGVNIFCDIKMCAKENFDASCAILADAAQVAKELSIPVLQVPAVYESLVTSEEELQNLAKVFRAACLACKDDGIIIASENVLTVEQNLSLLKAVDCENFALYFDTQNPVSFAGLNSTIQIPALVKHIAQLHLKDCDAALDPALLGTGATGFFETLAEFKKGNYDAWMLSETDYNWLMEKTGESFEALLAKDMATIATL